MAISLGMMVGASLLQTAAEPSSWLDAPPPIRSPVVTSPPAFSAPVNGVARSAARFRPDAAYRRLVSQASRARRRAP